MLSRYEVLFNLRFNGKKLCAKNATELIAQNIDNVIVSAEVNCSLVCGQILRESFG